ncbi:acetyl-CoA carboxylase biotin carboxyl carrier protein subunit [Albibacterium bauzanense]|uniref:Biotin carboxyl carrier protein n=1 Tax=Albibacterium bauzanense TaxID=653929 RepID=A0A4V2PXN6_9SPHI|nr:acetyl-CoA carboxylase biotin carboxyl carrier protein subunit [Albibacterium bauzanense]TCK82821.1 biotin carboxyl carrier protein [Albibacterium bauzanense]
MMKHILVNNNGTYAIQMEGEDVLVDGSLIQLDLEDYSNNHIHVLLKGKSYSAEIVTVNYKEKEAEIKINGNLYHISLKDEKDALLESLGMELNKAQSVSNLKAPMPGLVLEIRVKAGDKVNKGDCLLVLEAMKMENLIKSPLDITIKSVEIYKGDKVEKNQVLIQFDNTI